MIRLALALAGCLLLLCAPARAQETLAPPGNSGVQQYLETVPGASGNQAVKRGKTPLLAPRVRRQLESRGSDGKKLEALVDSTAPRREQQVHNSPPRAAPHAAQRGDSPLEGFGRSVTDSADAGGMGVVLPIVLGASTLLLALAALLRRRRHTG
jgi:hypothetical protein